MSTCTKTNNRQIHKFFVYWVKAPVSQNPQRCESGNKLESQVHRCGVAKENELSTSSTQIQCWQREGAISPPAARKAQNGRSWEKLGICYTGWVPSPTCPINQLLLPCSWQNSSQTTGSEDFWNQDLILFSTGHPVVEPIATTHLVPWHWLKAFWCFSYN